MFSSISLAQENNTLLLEKVESLQKDNENLRHRLDVLDKQNQDILWYKK